MVALIERSLPENERSVLQFPAGNFQRAISSGQFPTGNFQRAISSERSNRREFLRHHLPRHDFLNLASDGYRVFAHEPSPGGTLQSTDVP
jgi:hypothetical protein